MSSNAIGEDCMLRFLGCPAATWSSGTSAFCGEDGWLTIQGVSAAANAS